MAPAYKRKTQDKYSKDDLEQALSDIQNKRLSIKTAVAHYHIPTRTIFHRLAGSRTGTERWFAHLNVVLTKDKLLNNRHEAIWNVDESGFGDDPDKRSVIIKRDSKHAISCQPGTGKSYTTVIMCTSASGEKLLPYIIYRSMKLWSTWIPKNGYPGTRYNATLSGWVDEEVFYDWFVNRFLPAVAYIQRPLILLFDGHRAHISTRIVKMISELWKNHVLKGHCSGDFAKAGIYPYDPRAVSKEKLLGPSSSNDESTSVDDSAVIHQPVNRLTQSASYAPVFTDLSNNNMVTMDNSLGSTQAPINVLSDVISHGRPRKVTQQQQVLDEIDALSDLDPHSDFNITTSSTAIDSNRHTTDTNNYQHINTDPSHHVSFYDTQQLQQMFPSCYRCNTAIYGNFTNCNKCGRYCCQLCVQNYFFFDSMTCEYCAMHQAIADFDTL
ncbi:unnamed protein product [Rotaria magnacalcarata]|uniref:DDE-1 domain-containing protein n=1 Tax=Rotaria magnacalcarata TaxID=392030 RepID=A0A816NYS3_9BILA|nr:unnamed protein product [Rotaria magnacalcarata]